MQFTKAQRQKAKLRLGLTGASGSGKTYSALQIAKGLGGRIAVIDTEHGSASLYSNDFDFDVLELDAPYSPERYIHAINAAEQAGYDVLIIDSITHEWSGSGGCLEINDITAKTQFKGNTWSAWSQTTPRHQAFIDKLISSKLHIIATMRSKTETVQENKTVFKVGLKAEQRDGMEYEFTTILDISHGSHLTTASKDRTKLFMGADPFVITPDVGQSLNDWLNTGAETYIGQAEQQELVNIAQHIQDGNIRQRIFEKHPNFDFSNVRIGKFDELKSWLLSKIENQRNVQDES